MARKKRLMSFGQVRVNSDSIQIFGMASESMSTAEREIVALDLAIKKLQNERIDRYNEWMKVRKPTNPILFRKFDF